jgi:NADPH:quinone reductase-like Zn-dependent oxidoreductase
VPAGDLTVNIDRTYTLDQASQALKDFAAGKRGKLAINIA